MINLKHLNNNHDIEISELIRKIRSNYPNKYKPMSPLWNFHWFAKDNKQFYCSKSESPNYITYWFDLYETNLDKKIIKTMKSLYSFNGQQIYRCKLRKIYLGLNIHKKDNKQSLVIQTRYKDYIPIYKVNEPDFLIFDNGKIGINYHLYENQEIWNYKTKNKTYNNEKPFCYKCTMKDFFFFKEDSLERTLLMEFFELWGSEFKIWKDLLKDFQQGTAFSAIPLKTILNSHNRKELIELRYGKECSFNRNNRETIGKGIFLARAKRVIEPNDFNLIMNIPDDYLNGEFIGREKTDTLFAISKFLIDKYPWLLKYFRNDRILSEYLFDRVKHKIRIKLNFTEQTFNKWCLETDIKINTHKNRIHFNKEASINNLKIDEFKVVKTTKALAQECIKQNIDLTNYIHRINKGQIALYNYRYHNNEHLLIIKRLKSKNAEIFLIEKMYKNKKTIKKKSNEYIAISIILNTINGNTNPQSTSGFE